jgi:hypothetical protein
MTADFGQINQKTKRPKYVMNQTIVTRLVINKLGIFWLEKWEQPYRMSVFTPKQGTIFRDRSV